MKQFAFALVATSLFMGLAQQANSADSTSTKQKEKKALKIGDTAPPFELKGTDGKVHKLSDYKNKSVVVVAWYPKALTGG